MEAVLTAPSAKALRLVGWAMAITYAVMALIHVIDLARPGALQGFVASLVTEALLLATLAYTRVRAPTTRATNHIQGVFALVVLANVALHYASARDPSVAAMFVFYMLGAGGLLFHRAWVLVALAASYTCWLVATLLVVPHANAARDGLAMATTIGVSWFIYTARIRTLRSMEVLHGEAERGRRNAEARLASLERLQESLSTLVERSQEGMAVHRGGRVLFANGRLAEVLGYEDSASLVGLEIGELLDLGTLEPGATALPVELRTRRRDGELLVLELAGRPIEWEQETAVLLSLRDVTVRHTALNERLTRADRLLTVGRLAASAAHEINNPLSAVLGNLTELSAEPLREEARAWLADAQRGAQRVDAIVMRLGSFVRPPSARPGRVDVVEVLEYCLRMVQHEVDAVAKVERKFLARPTVETDEHLLGQIFVHLLTNARQAMAGREPGTLTLTVRATEADVFVDIADTGVGMTASIQARLFEPFFTTRPVGQGMGLGLHFCHSTLMALGGGISTVSEVDVGSVFTVRLPSRSPPAEDVPSPLPELAPRRILVVDDEVIVGRVVARMLRGHDVVVARSGEEGLALMKREPFDAIVCDVVMPGVDGVEIYEQAKAMGLEGRVVFITGGGLKAATREFLDATEAPVVRKPVERSLLLQALVGLPGEPPPQKP